MKHDANTILHKAADSYGKRLYWHIRRLVVSHADAEDALQETFIKVFTKADSFKGDESSLEAWCYRIATNEALQLLRRRAHMFQSLDSLGSELALQVATESAPDADKSSILFQQAIMQLSTQQRIAFNLRYYDELPYSQIAEITGKSENSLRTNYHYAVEKIKDYLKEHAI
ncbi:MAG: sigma-70 family RNA polymerase sigma factor [Bacteroidales bacterium]|nr:sigma-70 family RNA polymerase sigma factor [Bacteroidales bacterium]